MFGSFSFYFCQTSLKSPSLTHTHHRQLKLNNELNNMSWRVRPDEILLEVGRLFGSKMGLQKLNFEVKVRIKLFYR